MITPEQIAKSGSEHAEQTALFAHAAIMARTEPLWALLFAIPNGGKRDKATAARLKAEGVKPGVPDVCLPVARGRMHALYIEMKKINEGEISDDQFEWINNLKKQGNCVLVCYGWIEAASAVTSYLNLRSISTFD